MNEPLYRDYASLAWFYNRYWGTTYHGLVLPVLDRLVLSRLPKSSLILDVCCGTGHLAKELIHGGFEVTGIDGSKEMLGFARKRTPEATFLTADARSFSLPPSFHTALPPLKA